MNNAHHFWYKLLIYTRFHIRESIIILAFLAIVPMSSCTKDTSIPEQVISDKFGYITIKLNTPEPHIPTTRANGTRAMNSQMESTIDHKKLNVLVFRYNDDGDGSITETFYSNASISESIIYDENNATITAKLAKSASQDDLYRIVVVANYDLSDIDIIENTTTKERVLEQLIFSVPEKWSADTDIYTPFPMWGENVPIVISDNMPSPTINLYRALSGIDVGLNFAVDNGKLTNQAYGIPNFKLKEVSVFRTYDKGYAAPLSTAIETPSVPPDALRHGDNSPLSYIIPDSEGVNSYTREIYIPVVDLPLNPTNDNIHCLIIGGYYQSSSVMSYYRLDFATDSEPEGRAYLPILRNHRYIFNITQVSGPGFASVASALESISTTGNVNYDLIAWDTTIHEMETQGKYYFGIDNRDLLAEAHSTNSDPKNRFTVKYQTNYPLSESNPLRSIWASTIDNPESSPAFDAQWQSDSKNIIITIKTDNLENSLLTDTLYVHAGPFVKKIVVQQKYFDVKYSINCSSVAVNGVYKHGVVLNSGHYITLSITADNRAMQGHPYIIETTDPFDHGIRFRAEGIFDFTGIPQGSPLHLNNIQLMGSGTVNAPDGESRFSLPVVSDSPIGSSCEATIRLVIPKMNVLVIASMDSEFNYALSDIGGGANKILTSPNNFGAEDNSIVGIEGFTFISHNSNNNSDFSVPTTDNAYRWLTGIGNNGKIADIVYLANYVVFNKRSSELLVDYLDKGGVVIAFNENNTSGVFASTLFASTSITTASYGPAGAIYPFPAHSHYGQDENLQDILSRFEGDPILNGPFGDVRDKQWGEDGNTTMHLNNLPPDPGLTIYSYRENISPEKAIITKGAVNAFRYESENRNIVWFGDGGFMASKNGMPHESKSLCPLNWNLETFFPEPKLVYGHINTIPVYNSVVFCNIMAWAVQKSESLREKRLTREGESRAKFTE